MFLLVAFVAVVAAAAHAYIQSTAPAAFGQQWSANIVVGASPGVRADLGDDLERFVQEQMMDVARVAWAQQFGVRFNVSVLTGDIGIPDTCDLNSVYAQLVRMNNWTQVGLFVYLTDCGPGGIGGLATQNAFCDSTAILTTKDALDMAHELGHAFGATHTIGLGGIMDYADGTFNGTYAFHPRSVPEVQSRLAALKQTCPRRFFAPVQHTCGDRVLQENEQCECLDGSTSCGSGNNTCVMCRTPRYCSPTDFVVRPAQMDGCIAATDDVLAWPSCCSTRRGRIRVNGGCGKRMGIVDGVCSTGGQCKSMCSAFLLSTCDRGTCADKCWVGGKCTALINAFDGTPIPRHLEAAPCAFNATHLGFCVLGKCIFM